MWLDVFNGRVSPDKRTASPPSGCSGVELDSGCGLATHDLPERLDVRPLRGEGADADPQHPAGIAVCGKDGRPRTSPARPGRHGWRVDHSEGGTDDVRGDIQRAGQRERLRAPP